MVRTTQSIHFNTERPKLFILHTTTVLSTMLLPQRRTVPKLWTKMFVVVLNIMLLMMSLEVDVAMAQTASPSNRPSRDPSSRCVTCEIMHSFATTVNQSLTLCIIVSGQAVTHRVDRPVIRHPGEYNVRHSTPIFLNGDGCISSFKISATPYMYPGQAVIHHRGECNLL